MHKLINSNSFENEITNDYLTYHVYLLKCVQTNIFCQISTVTLQYLKPFNCVQTNELKLL